MELEINTSIQVQQAAHKVFKAIVDPDMMKHYFIEKSSGRLENGKEVTWKFAEFESEFPIRNILIKDQKHISFVWDPDTKVQIRLESVHENATIIRITEGSKEFNEQNVRWALENTEGWANFLASLKAFIEYDINLRKGAFDFIKK